MLLSLKQSKAEMGNPEITGGAVSEKPGTHRNGVPRPACTC